VLTLVLLSGRQEHAIHYSIGIAEKAGVWNSKFLSLQDSEPLLLQLSLQIAWFDPTDFVRACRVALMKIGMRAVMRGFLIHRTYRFGVCVFLPMALSMTTFMLLTTTMSSTLLQNRL
jgi:hypothetical protein